MSGLSAQSNSSWKRSRWGQRKPRHPFVWGLSDQRSGIREQRLGPGTRNLETRNQQSELRDYGSGTRDHISGTRDQKSETRYQRLGIGKKGSGARTRSVMGLGQVGGLGRKEADHRWQQSPPPREMIPRFFDAIPRETGRAEVVQRTGRWGLTLRCFSLGQ